MRQLKDAGIPAIVTPAEALTRYELGAPSARVAVPPEKKEEEQIMNRITFPLKLRMHSQKSRIFSFWRVVSEQNHFSSKALDPAF